MVVSLFRCFMVSVSMCFYVRICVCVHSWMCVFACVIANFVVYVFMRFAVSLLVCRFEHLFV